MTDTLPVSEVFGPTVQGEGPHAGRACAFIRLGGCNLSCAWCDSGFTWDAARYDLRAEIRHQPVAEIVGRLPAVDLPVVVTGGEPMLQQRRPPWSRLLDVLHGIGDVWLETNGTIAPTEHTMRRIDCAVVSPKMPNAGPHRGRQRPDVAAEWADHRWRDKIHFKYVVAAGGDVTDALDHASRYVPRSRTWLMPETTSPARHAELWPMVAETAAAYGVNASPRLHVLAWGDQRGR